MRRRRANVARAKTVGAAVLGVATLAGFVIYDLVRGRSPGIRHPPLDLGPQGSAPPPVEPLAVEPDEGYESRWSSRRNHAIRRCKMDPAVLTWPQAVTCALTYAYPEAGPWDDPSAWPPWMAEASALVDTDLQAAVAAMFPGTIPNGWQAQLWLRGAREAVRCKQSTPDLPSAAACVGAAIYPLISFPPGADAPPWLQQFWLAVRRLSVGHAS